MIQCFVAAICAAHRGGRSIAKLMFGQSRVIREMPKQRARLVKLSHLVCEGIEGSRHESRSKCQAPLPQMPGHQAQASGNDYL